MLPPKQQPRVVTTLHGTDTTLLGCDPGYGPAIRHALACSDAITTVSAYLKSETQRLLPVEGPIDVIHNFFVRELRLKQDIVPGMEIPMHFQADKIGVYEVPCSELCGLGHHQMRTTLEVMSPADFEKWLRDQAAQK